MREYPALLSRGRGTDRCQSPSTPYAETTIGPVSIVWVGAMGSKAMVRALFMAVVSLRWCFAQVPVFRRGSIFALSEMKRFSFVGSLYSMVFTLSTQNEQTLRLRANHVLPPRRSLGGPDLDLDWTNLDHPFLELAQRRDDRTQYVLT